MWPEHKAEWRICGRNLTVILSAQSTAGRWSIHIAFGLTEQAMSLDSASAIGLCPRSITLLAAALYRVTVIFRIL